MLHIMLPVGIDSFEKLRTNQCYYIDKTGLICFIRTATIKETPC